MSRPTENETWVIEAGDVIIKKMVCDVANSLTPWERLVYCLWVCDYGMRNAGDLETAADVDSRFRTDAQQISEALSLALTHATFMLSKDVLEKEYFDRFEAICDEIRQSKSATVNLVEVRKRRRKSDGST